jgi:chemotaxis protein histidine kinase CheA
MADSIISYEDLIGQDDTFDVIFQNIDQLKKELVELAQMQKSQLGLINPNDEEAVRNATKEVQNLTNAMKKLETEEKKAQKTKKKSNDLTNEELIAREKQKIANRERIQVAKQMAILQSKESGEIEKLRAKLSLTTLQWKKLTKEELNNTKKGKNLIKTKRDLTNQLKKLEKQTGDNRRNVGNYASSLGKLGKVAAGVFIGRGIGQAIRNIGRAMGNLIEQNKEANPELQKMSDNFVGLKASVSNIGVSILNTLAPAINWILGKLSLLPAVFSGVGAALGVIKEKFTDTFASARISIGRLIVEAKLLISPFDVESLIKRKKLEEEQTALLVRQYSTRKGIAEAFNDAFKASKEQIIVDKENAILAKKKEESAKKTADRLKEQNALLKKQEKLQKDIDARIKAIASLQMQIEMAEAQNIEDKTERLLALEDLRFKALQQKREKNFDAFLKLQENQEKTLIDIYGENSAEVIAFRDESAKEALKVEADNQRLSEEQLQASENKKLQIIKDKMSAARKIVKDAQKLVKKQTEEDEKLILDSIKSIDGEQEKVDKKRQERLKKKADMEKQLMEGIQKTAEKVGAAIIDTFNKQAEGAASLVEQQSAAVETQRERAEQGLSNTLKFEQEQLAQREAERIRAEKKAKQAAELVALFNLVSAYAASGDSNALARGLVDWSLLKALSEGFEEGGYTGAGSSNSDVAGLVHKNEYVVTADDVKRYGLTGRAGGDFGEAMSDYFYSPLQRNMYLDQKGRFNEGLNSPANTFSRLENEVRAMRRAFEDMPKNDFDIMQMTDYFVEISKRVTSNRMTNISKQRKRL